VSRSIFLDTSAWFAALSPRDQWHSAALEAYSTAARTGHIFVATTFVVAEVHALLLRWRDVDTGRRFLDAAFNTPAHVVIAPDVELITEAVKRWIAKYRDQSLTLCDAVSFEVMRRERLTYALAFDDHFDVAGFDTPRR
jgi:predicted nucleic acid-binding protein